MKKPKPTTVTTTEIRLNWNEAQEFIENKYNIELSGYGLPKDRHEEFQKEGNGSVYASPQNYGGRYYACIDGKGEKIQVTEEQYEEEWVKSRALNKKYAEWKEAKYGEDPPYMDFFRYLSEYDEIVNGGYFYVPKKAYKCKNAEIGKGTPWEGWAQKITDIIFEEFGEHSDGDSIEFFVEW